VSFTVVLSISIKRNDKSFSFLHICAPMCMYMFVPGGPLTAGDVEDCGGHICVACPWHHYMIEISTDIKYYQNMTFNAKTRKVVCIAHAHYCHEQINLYVLLISNMNKEVCVCYSLLPALILKTMQAHAVDCYFNTRIPFAQTLLKCPQNWHQQLAKAVSIHRPSNICNTYMTSLLCRSGCGSSSVASRTAEAATAPTGWTATGFGGHVDDMRKCVWYK
jgi:hypothetical protein